MTHSAVCAFSAAVRLSRYHFTGKERDSESGNDYFGARYYASSMGRFLSADSGVDQDVEDPQSWNLYSYVRNNPIAKTDDDGRSVTVCSNDSSGTQHCTTMDDDVYRAAQQSQNNGGLSGPSLGSLESSSSGSGTITDSNGNAVGTVQWTPDNPGIQGPQAIQAFGQIGNQGMGAIKAFTVGSVAIGGTLGLAGVPTALLGGAEAASLVTEEATVLARAGSAVGNQGAKVASREVAEAIAKRFVGEGGRPLLDRATGKVIGEISADGTKIVRWTSIDKAQPYINLVNKLTGGNLHVGW